MKTIQSIDKAMAILNHIAAHNDEMVLSTLGRDLEMPLPTLHGFIASLEKWDLIRKDSRTGCYSIGNKIFQLASCCELEHKIIQICHPVLAELSAKFDETVHLAIPDGKGILYLDKIECSHPFRMTSLVGTRERLFDSAIGFAIAGNRRDIKLTTKEKTLLSQHVQGTVATLFHEDIDLNCFATAIFDRFHEVTAGISLAIPRCRYKETMSSRIIRQLELAVKRLEPLL